MSVRAVASLRRARQTDSVDFPRVRAKTNSPHTNWVGTIPPLKPILCKVGPVVGGDATKLLHRVFKAFCTRALSADAEGVFEKADSGGKALVLAVRAMRGFCAKFRVLETSLKSVILL